MMKLKKAGNKISQDEVSNIYQHGIWLLVNETEYFLPYDELLTMNF